MEILLKDKTIQGITVDGSIDGSVEIGEIFQFFCAVMGVVKVQGKANITMDNGTGMLDLVITEKEEKFNEG